MTIHVHYGIAFFVNIKFIYKHLVHYKADKRRRYSHFELSTPFFYFPKSKGAITMMIRSEDKNNFTWVHNTFIRDRRLSMAERGLLLTMMSMLENSSFSVTGLRGMVADRRDRVRSTVKALEDHGYLKRVQTCDENGLFNDVLYTFSDEPVFIDPEKLSEDTFIKFSAETDKKDPEKPDDSPISENPPTGAAPTETHSIYNNYNKERLIPRAALVYLAFDEEY